MVDVWIPALDKGTGALPPLVRGWLDDRYTSKPTVADKVVFVSTGGNDASDGFTAGSAKATLGAAVTAMGTSKGVIVLGVGDIPAGAGVAWPAAGKCGLIGQGKDKTRIVATAQNGPVVDLTTVGYNMNDVEIGGFTIVGDGTSGATKKGLALSPTVSMSRSYIHDIAVMSTGGACFDLGYAELVDFVRLVAYEPVNAGSSDIPYVTAAGAFNGNTLEGLQLYGVSTGANVGASGALVIKDNGSTAPHDNHIRTLKTENLHLPTGATVIAIRGNANVISDFEPFDAAKVSGATGTSSIRFQPPTGGVDTGGNIVRGVIPGKGSSALDIDMGIDMQQGRNRVEGVKGYKGTNVVIASGVNFTSVLLGGAVSGATDPAVVDSSGVLTNTVIDDFSNLTVRNAHTYQQGAAKCIMDVPGGAWAGGPRFYDATTPANGVVGVGTSGARMQGVGTSLYFVGDVTYLRTVALTPAPVVLGSSLATNVSWRSGAGSPEGVVTAAIGSLYSRTDGGASTSLYVKESGTGNTGWIAK